MRSFGERLIRVSILVRKRLYLRTVSEVQFGRKEFGYLDIRERPINTYSGLSSYGILNIEFQAISRSFGRGFNPGM